MSRIGAKLKMKVGAVSVTVEQHTEGRRHTEGGPCNGHVQRGSAHSRDDALECSSVKIA